MNANPLIDATARMSVKLNYLKSKKDESMFYVLNPIEMINVIVDIIKAPIAKGLALNTQSKFFRKINPPKKTSRISLKIF